MGVRYSGQVESIAPNTANDNWTLDVAANTSGKILEVHWGGEVTTSTAMHTKVSRTTAVGTTNTNGNVQKVHPYSVANKFNFVSAWTTQPTLATGALFAESWNAHGGLVRWLAAPGEEFIIIGAADISCRNSNGTATSTYGTIWEED